MFIIVILLFLFLNNLTISQIAFPTVSMPMVLSPNSLVSITPAITAWIANSTNPTQFTYKVSNFSTTINVNASIIRLLVHKSPFSNISFCYFETLDTFPHVLKKLISASNQTQPPQNFMSLSSTITEFTFVGDDGFYLVSNGTALWRLYLNSAGSYGQFCISSSAYRFVSMTFGNNIMFLLFKNTALGKFNIRIESYNDFGCTFKFNFTVANLTYQDCTTFSKVVYEPQSSLLLIFCPIKIQVWSYPNLTLVQQKTLDNVNLKNFATNVTESCFCGPYLVIITTEEIIYYNKSNWLRAGAKKFTQFFPSIVSASNLGCISSDGNIGFKAIYDTGTASLFAEPYNMTATNLPNFTNSTSSTNLTNGVNNTYIFEEPDQNFFIYFNWLFLNFLKSNQFNTTATVVSTTTGIASSNLILKQLFRPFLHLIDQFWLYKFHAVRYNEIFEYFATQTDVLDNFRIKPHFFDMQIKLPLIQNQNVQYIQTQSFKRRLPTIYILQSLKDIYIFNFLSSFFQFALIVILRKITRRIQIISFKLKRIYEFLHSNSIWWSLLISTIETNIVTISFYSSIQILCFYSFQFFDKINLLLAVFLLFVMACYSYLFYKLVYSYQHKKRSSVLLNIGLFGYNGFLLEMLLNCLRRLNGALIHGFLRDHHFLQLIFLIISDLIFVFIVFKMKLSFKSKFIAYITLVYYIAFFGLNSILLISTQTAFLQQNTNHSRIYISNFAIVCMILIILLVCLTKFVLACGAFANKIFKFITTQQETPPKKLKIVKGQTIRKDGSINIFSQHIECQKSSFKPDKNYNKQIITFQKGKKYNFSKKKSRNIVKIGIRMRKEEFKSKFHSYLS